MLTAFCFIALVFCKGGNTQTSHYGREFVLGMIPNHSAPTRIVVDIASEKEGLLYYSIPYLNINQNKTLRQGNTSINIDNSLTAHGNFTEQRGIFIATDVTVAIVMTSFYRDVMDSYLALPVPALGLHYRAASYTPYNSGTGANAEILIVAAHDGTNVSVRSNDNTYTSLVMNRLFVHQISSIKDLSNVEIVASKPVSVISGTICAYVPHDVHACDMLLEQMIPVELWTGDTFIVPPYYGSKGFLLKVLANSSSSVCLHYSTRTICNTSSHLWEKEFLMGTEPVVVTSRGHVSVVQYGLGEDYDNVGDEYMNLVPTVDNYLNDYKFVVPTVYSSLTSYLSVIIPSSQSNGLLLDGLIPTSQHQYFVPGLNYTVLVFDISVGYHRLNHSSYSINFGALVYGLSPARGYGFPLGFQFSGDKPTTSLSVSTSAPELSTTVTKGIYSTTNGSGQGKTCYSCDDMSHVELCDTIKHCSDTEICYLESYLKSGRKTFRSGCLHSSLCFRESEASKAMSDRCVDCCSHDYCNNKGCGESGFPAREQRGPLCYDCHHVWSQDECNTLALCEKGQVCSIEEYKWGDHSNFKMGCSNGLCNPLDRSVHISLRSVPVCHVCCENDYCNTNCTRVTTGNEGSIIVG